MSVWVQAVLVGCCLVLVYWVIRATFVLEDILAAIAGKEVKDGK